MLLYTNLCACSPEATVTGWLGAEAVSPREATDPVIAGVVPTGLPLRFPQNANFHTCSPEATVQGWLGAEAVSPREATDPVVVGIVPLTGLPLWCPAECAGKYSYSG